MNEQIQGTTESLVEEKAVTTDAADTGAPCENPSAAVQPEYAVESQDNGGLAPDVQIETSAQSENPEESAAQEIGAPAVIQQADEPGIEPAAAVDQHPDANLKAAIESMLFASDKPLLIDTLRKVLDNLPGDKIRTLIEHLKAEYESSGRGIRIIEIAGGFQMIATPAFAPFLKKLFKGPQNSEKLSKSAMETLAIIAYKQPLSKLEIESLRRVNVDGVMQTLQEKNIIKVVGRKKTPGRPKVYGTTRFFLEYFGLKSLDELPKIESFPVPADSSAPKDEIEPIENDETKQADTEEGQDVVTETTVAG